MKADELEACLKAIRKLAHDLGEHWAKRIREDHDRVDEVLDGVREVALATANYGYCELPSGCIALDASDCLARGGTPVTACPRNTGAPVRSKALNERLGPKK